MSGLFVVACAALGVVAGVAGRGWLLRLRRGTRPPRGWCECGVALVWAVCAVRGVLGGLGLWWLPLPAVLGWSGVLLTVCDVREQRLPTALTGALYPAVAAALAVAWLYGPVPGLPGRAVAGALVLGGCYALVRACSPAALGGGDVKLAGGLGAATGAVSWPALAVSVLFSAVLTLATAAVTRRRGVPHGPAMLAAAWVVVLVAGLGG